MKRYNSRYTGRQNKPHKWLAFENIWSVQELETLPAGTKPRASRTVDRLEERGMEREALDNLIWKNEMDIISQTNLEPFQRQHWGNFWGWGEGGLHMGLSEGIDTILFWSELKWHWQLQSSEVLHRSSTELTSLKDKNIGGGGGGGADMFSFLLTCPTLSAFAQMGVMKKSVAWWKMCNFPHRGYG